MELRHFGADIELPEPSSDDSFVFEQDTLPVPPGRLQASEAFVLVGGRSYNGIWPCPKVHLLAPKRTLRGLGLVLLAHAFHQSNKEIHVGVTPAAVGTDPPTPRPTEIRFDLDGYRYGTKAGPVGSSIGRSGTRTPPLFPANIHGSIACRLTSTTSLGLGWAMKTGSSRGPMSKVSSTASAASRRPFAWRSYCWT